MTRFIKEKLKGARVKSLVLDQIESMVLGLVSWIPSIFGMMIRNVVYRMLGMKIRGFCWVQHGVTIVSLRNMKVGADFGCNTGSYINAVGGITFGSQVLIGSNVTISSGRHEIEGRSASIISRPTTPLRTTIGNDVWIGAGASILAGVTVEDGTVVGANAVVTKDTLPYSVMVGIPARVLRFR